MASLKNKLIVMLAMLLATKAEPDCKSLNNNNVKCTAGNEDYELVRGLVSDNNKTVSVTLRSCRIIDVEYESFNDLTSLTYLDLSRNKIIRLKLGVLDEPKQLTHLNLSYNRLTEFPLGIFDQITDIEILDLKGNKINNLELGIFDHLTKLSSIDLSSNQLQGKNLNPYIFDQSPHITFIDFSRNNMNGTPENMLNAFESLKYLTLDRAFLREVPEFLTKPNLKTLKDLILTNNQISALNNEATFLNLDKLESLDLSNNVIEYINENMFKPMKNLQKVILRNNRMKVLPENLFRDIPKLISILLVSNQIENVPLNAFRGTPLKNLNLSNNKITYLASNFCLEMKNSGGRLKKFLFHPNPWQCACLNELIKEVKLYGIEYNSTKYNGQNQVCVSTNEYNCKRHKEFNDFYVDLYNEVVKV